MIKIAGTCILIIFLLFILWLYAKFSIEANHIINKKIKQRGYKGNYSTYKKLLKNDKIR